VVGLLGALGEPRRVRVEEWDGRGVGALGHDLYKKGRGPALRTPPLLFLPLFTRVRRREILRHEQRAVEPVLVSEKPGRLLGNRLHSDRRGRGCGHDRCHGRCRKRGLSGLQVIPRRLARCLTDRGTWGFAELVELAYECHRLKTR
jgi:hypothetical protein